MNEFIEDLFQKMITKQEEVNTQLEHNTNSKLFTFLQGKKEAYGDAGDIVRQMKLDLMRKTSDFNQIYVVAYIDTNKIMYCGHDVKEANNWLEMSHYSKDEADKYQMRIYSRDGSLLNEGIKRKIAIKYG